MRGFCYYILHLKSPFFIKGHFLRNSIATHLAGASPVMAGYWDEAASPEMWSAHSLMKRSRRYHSSFIGIE